MAQRIPDRSIARLSKYLFRAQMMRDTAHSMVEQHEPGLKTLSKDDWWEFETFLFYWLSALFVLVEGFNKLKLKDTRIQKLFKEQCPSSEDGAPMQRTTSFWNKGQAMLKC
jgi:hypothetical protein